MLFRNKVILNIAMISIVFFGTVLPALAVEDTRIESNKIQTHSARPIGLSPNLYSFILV